MCYSGIDTSGTRIGQNIPQNFIDNLKPNNNIISFKSRPNYEYNTDSIVEENSVEKGITTEDISILTKALRVGDAMNDDDMLKIYINKIDTDQRDLKSEMREREERMIKSSEDAEKRMSDSISSINIAIEKQNAMIETKFNRMEDEMKSSVKDIKSNKLTIIFALLGFLVSLGAVIIAGIQVVESLVSMVK